MTYLILRRLEGVDIVADVVDRFLSPETAVAEGTVQYFHIGVEIR